MRGSHGVSEQWLRDGGIIPAGAGLTYLFRGKIICPGDHPRGCGAHHISLRMQMAWAGSSPRVRGSHEVTRLIQPVLGIIPAGAGLTDVTYVFWGRNGDHPRGCGAHLDSQAIAFPSRGSSPRVRGSHILQHRLIPDNGIIPAGAGLTFLRHAFIAVPRDHPRGCGAHRCLKRSPSPLAGSSPRVRGSPDQRSRT